MAESVIGEKTDFFFPSYRIAQPPEHTAWLPSGGSSFIEMVIPRTKLQSEEVLRVDVDIFQENVDTIVFQLMTMQEQVILHNRRSVPSGYSYLPAQTFRHGDLKKKMALYEDDQFKIRIDIVPGGENARFIIGRMDVTVPRYYSFEVGDRMDLPALLERLPPISTAPAEDETFVELPGSYGRYGGFRFIPELGMSPLCRNARDSVLYVALFVEKLLDQYPFYSRISVGKDSLFQMHHRITETSQDMESYYRKLKRLVSRLDNCHYTLALPGAQNPQPLAFHRINGHTVLVGKFLPQLDSTIDLGERLVSINGMPVDELYEHLSDQVFAGGKEQKEYKITQRLVGCAWEYFGTESLEMKFETKENPVRQLILDANMLSSRPKIPEEFRVLPPFAFETFGDAAYLRIHFYEESVVPFIFSHLEELKASKGLVLDLRGVSDGDLSFCKFFSFFTDRLAPILSEPAIDESLSGSEDLCQTYVIRPSQVFYYDKPVIVLIDSRTTCASELLIHALKNVRDDVYTAGYQRSAGSAQLSQVYLLPEARFGFFQGETRNAADRPIDLDGGIVPDILSEIDSWRDLIPYDDRLKQNTLKIIQNLYYDYIN